MLLAPSDRPRHLVALLHFDMHGADILVPGIRDDAHAARDVLSILFYDWILSATDPEQQDSCVATCFSSRPMVFLGDISMCVYMLHMLISQAFNMAIGRRQLPLWGIPICLVLAIGLGWIFTQFFEKPVANLLRPRKKAQAAGAEEQSDHNAERLGRSGVGGGGRSPVQVVGGM